MGIIIAGFATCGKSILGKKYDNIANINAGVVELVDAIDSKSIIGNYVWVRVPPPAPNKTNRTAGAIFL